MFGGSSEPPTTVERAVIKSYRWAQFSQHSRKLGGAAGPLIDGSEKRFCWLTFEFKSPQTIPFSIPFLTFFSGSFAFRDHLRSWYHLNLRFCDHLQSWDHWRTRTDRLYFHRTAEMFCKQLDLCLHFFLPQ